MHKPESIIVTGGAGFIGANLVAALNAAGERNIIVVDDLTDGHKIRNLADLQIADYLDKDDFAELVERRALPPPRVLFHQGACSTTTEWNGRYVMEVNYRYSKRLLHWCLEQARPFIYASSASVYGAGAVFAEDPAHEHPLNPYAYSKWQFDQYLRQLGPTASQVVGLRYFNVYGPREQHKGAMASVFWHFRKQILDSGEARLFAGCDGYGDGEQRRDFVYVGDVVDLNLWFWRHPQVSGIFNAGTGRSQTFREAAEAVIAALGRGSIRYIPFPEHLKGAYQSYTQADLGRLRAAGCTQEFLDVAAGAQRYLQALARQGD
ncbi:ADP-glyceromanno-heptose 6-epimerase precursor [Solimonas aquatica]|uniref:ADP-L-glycero-D-manno-heptose-6-epimerase n=1 Tax=Solimonas aquatica TaxID=489703 RepID=A0A1H9CLJ6_9GAMM|nr:ADP-glyceromanno-heptose 6-epimerase [Solimonas aquatica]SEQ02082.1 ADP-glyceromanno-heptose 6-epimerase precursor [Solimonas aquatica]